MPTDTKLNNLIINYLTQAQYDAIQTPNENELYLTPDNSTGGGGASVSPCLNLMDLETHSVRTSITEEEKNNLDKGLYNSVFYYDESWGENAEISITLPQLLTKDDSGMYVATIYTGSISNDVPSISGLLLYSIEIGEKNTDGTYPITITKVNEASFGGGGATPVVEATLNEDSSITLPEAQTTNFIIHNEELGYIYVNNINGTYSAIIPVGKDIAYVLTGTETTITLSFPILLNMVEGTAGELVDGKVSISIPSSHDFPFLLNIDRQGIFYISAYENNSNEIVYDGIGARKDNAGNNQLAIFSGKGTNLTMDVVPLGGGTSTSIAFKDVTVSELSNYNGKFENLHITDMKVKMTIFGSEQEFTGVNFSGTCSGSNLYGTAWLPQGTILGCGTFTFDTVTKTIKNGECSLGGTLSAVSVGNIFMPGAYTEFNSKYGADLIPTAIDIGSVLFVGKAEINNSGTQCIAYVGVNNAAPTGDETWCSLTGMFGNKGFGVAEFKKDSSGNPAFKSFTTWLPPVTTNSEGKSLIVTNGNAQWTTTPRYEHTITIKNSAGKILWTQTMRNSSNTVVNSYANLKTLFGEATYAGFGEYCQLNLEGGTEATDKLIKADGTEVTLASLGAIVYTDKCFLPK